ncbi:hypothetical protein FSARC_1835 [Fusarium sarcochroum]|uniref:Aminoglycoside phosphotransferase domain-containing protein n=1 Tax=Fusarium sarcochroum TaxID=1208366 RepID=A0A8H4U7I8_9HYPO|nr:hypothetical protein FSARC_1835 [Fusarium sarcochroum]
MQPPPPHWPPQPDNNPRLEIDDNSWMIGQVIISRHASKPSGPCWDDGKGAFFTISEAPNPKPPTRPISDDCPIKDWYAWEPSPYGRWEIGNAHLAINPDKGAPEHVTLEVLSKRSLSFQIPKVYYHAVHDELYYVVHSTLPGKTILDAWPETDDEALKLQWVDKIVDAYVELSAWRGETISGVNGHFLFEWWLGKDPFSYPDPYKPELLLQSTEEIGLDNSKLVFTHNHLSPLSFTVNEDGELLGIYLWHDAGFLPKDWIATKARFNTFLDASPRAQAWSRQDKNEWESCIHNALEKRGFREYFEKNGLWRVETMREWRESGRF